MTSYNDKPGAIAKSKPRERHRRRQQKGSILVEACLAVGLVAGALSLLQVALLHVAQWWLQHQSHRLLFCIAESRQQAHRCETPIRRSVALITPWIHSIQWRSRRDDQGVGLLVHYHLRWPPGPTHTFGVGPIPRQWVRP